MRPISTNELMNEIKEIIEVKFPKGYLDIWYSNHLTPSVNFRFAFNKKEDCPNGYIENDKGHHLFSISGVSNMLDTIEGKIKVELLISRTKYNYRKKTGTPEQALKHLDKYFDKVKEYENAQR